MEKYTIKYHAGTYEGTRTIWAESEYEAIEKVKKEIRGLMTTPMYSDGYKVIDVKECEYDYED